MSLEGKKDTDRWFPVILTLASDFLTALTGTVYGNVVCKYSFEAATSQTTYSVATEDWKEAGEGTYWLRIGAAEFTAEGKYEVSVTVATALVFNFAVEVRDENLADLLDTVDDIEADTSELQTDDIPGSLSTLATAVGNIPTTMVGTDGAALASSWTAEKAGYLDSSLSALATAVGNIPTTMRGTDGATLSSMWTDAKAGYLDVALSVLQTAIGNIPTTMVGTNGAALATEVDKLIVALVNKMIVTESSGGVEQFDAAGTSLGSIAVAFTSDGTYTTRKRLVI